MSNKYTSLSIPKPLISEIERYIKKNQQLGYKSVAEFVKSVIREKLDRGNST